MEHFPVISVIIPAYNARETLERACASVWTQSYPNVELVVVDDGSTDTTGALLESLSRENPSLHVVSQENGGVCRARNAGLAAATGSLICFLDADDELMPDALKALWDTMEKTGSDIVAGCCLRVRPDGSSFESGFSLSREVELWQGLVPLEQSLKDHPATYAVWGKLYRRQAIGDTRFIEGRRIHEDSFFLFSLFQRELTMAVTNLVVVRYHLTDNSASRSRFSEKHLDILYFSQEKQRILEETHPEYRDLGKNMQVKACLALLKLLSRGCPREYRSVQKQCQQVVRENARWFIPAIRTDRVLFAVVRLHVFWLYQWVYRLVKGR